MRTAICSSSVVIALVASIAACGGKAADPAEPSPEYVTNGPDPGASNTQPEGSGPLAQRIAEDVGTPSAIALTDREIVFTTSATKTGGALVNAGALFVSNKQNGPALMLSIDGRGASYGALAAQDDAAWVAVSDGRVLRVPLRGGEEKVIAQLAKPAVAISVSGDSVYLASATGAVVRAPKEGGKVEAIGTAPGAVRGITVEGDTVYAAVAKSNDQGGAIARMKLGGAVDVVAPSAGEPCAIVKDERSLFWTSLPGAVLRVSLDGGDAATVASGTFSACAIASDATSLYFATKAGEPGLMRAPIAGGEPIRVEVGASAAPLTHAGAVAVDASHIFWLSATSVLRIGK